VHNQAMTPWQHAHLVVIFKGEHTEETGLIFKKKFQVQDWNVQWAGPEGEGQDTRSGLAGTPVQVLNELGAEGWEVVAAFREENRFEYVLSDALDSQRYRYNFHRCRSRSTSLSCRCQRDRFAE
jgi:hypothetical protein